jgi:hypothetical protein
MSDHLIDRPVLRRPCHGCGRHVLTAIDGGLMVAADPESLTLNEEITARIRGLAAYDILVTGTHAYLAYRGVFRVTPERSYPVVADHVCPWRARPAYRLIPPEKPVKRKAAVKAVPNAEDECPF